MADDKKAYWLKGEKILLTDAQAHAMNEHAKEAAGSKSSESEQHAYDYLVANGLVESSNGKKSKSKKSE